MSGQDFICVLQQLGFENLNNMTGQSFAWVSDYDPLLPFLDWFCTELQATNVLTSNELEQFQKLESADKGYQILEGNHLEDALCTWSQFADESGSDAAMMQLQHELHHYSQRKDELKSIHDRLIVHHTAVADQTAQLASISTACKAELHHVAEQVHLDNSIVNRTLQLLVPSVYKLRSDYQTLETCSETADTDNALVFLSRLSLDEYHVAEEHFTQELVGFTKKQFFEGVAEISGQSGLNDYELIEIANPDLLLIKGARKDVVFEACKDLSYLHSFYPASESKWINSFLEEERVAAACRFQEQVVAELQTNPCSADVHDMSAKLKTAQASDAAVERVLTFLTDSEIPALVRDVASLQAVRVLCGDYDLKIARQDYFTSNQNQVIKELTMQRARSELFTMALEIEQRSHHHVQKLLTAVSLLLQQTSACLHDRMMLMSELEKNSCRVTRSTLDTRDTFMHSIYHVLDDSSENAAKSLFVAYSAIDEKSSNLFHHLAAVKTSVSTLCQTDHGAFATLEQKLSNCTNLLYADNHTVGGQPVLSPRVIVGAVLQLEALLNKLEPVVASVMKDIDNKKLVLQKDALLRTERQLFTYFFTATGRLRQTLADTESHLRATRLT